MGPAEIDGSGASETGKDAFLLAVAHDLRASIAALAGSLAVLRRGLGNLSPDRVDALVDSMEQAVADAEEVLTNLLSVERLELGATVLLRAPTRLPALVERAVAAARASDRVVLEVDDAVVDLDGGLTERILVNLVQNAATHAGPSTPIVVSVRDHGDHVGIHVDDTGPGIPAGMRDELFEPFHRSTGQGLGVGLHLVREFARMHGGDAWVDDLPTGGTSVRVRLPTP